VNASGHVEASGGGELERTAGLSTAAARERRRGKGGKETKKKGGEVET
jgi:hypothetical protein